MTYKHIAEPLTAEQIRRGVGVTPEETAYVRKVLRELGYLEGGDVPEKTAASKPDSSERRERTDK
ncbi:MAG: hypothetical protein ACLGI9_16795 [Thermoanaerobaculia bacterium]